MNKTTIKTLIFVILVLSSNTILSSSIGGIAIDPVASNFVAPSTNGGSVPGDWIIIAEDIAVEWEDTTIDDNLRESIYSLVVGDWVWTNPFSSENILFDEIEVRRLVRNDITEYIDAILILPMMFTDANAMFHWEDYFTGEQLNNPIEMFIYPYIEAGFDVYCLSTRDHNVPVEFYYDSASWTEMMPWGAKTYLSDIHKAVELIKIISGFNRIYLNTQEIGTALGMMYAVEHEENLKGIIAISGGTGGMLDKPPLIPTTLPATIPIENLEAVYEYIEADGTWYGLGVALFDFMHNYFYEAFKYPDSEDIVNSPFGDISWFMILGYFTGFAGTGDPELWEYLLLHVLGLPLEPVTLSADSKIDAIELYILEFLGISLLIPGYSMKAEDWLGAIMISHPIYPLRVLIDIQHMSQVENSEYLELDWDQYFCEINIPILTFVDTLVVSWWDQADYSDDTKNPDNIVYIMENQGVYDLFLGALYRELIIQPSIQWIMDRHNAQYVSVGEIYIDGETIQAVMFLHEDYINVFLIVEREYIRFEVTYYNDQHPRIIWEGVNEVYGDIRGGINPKGKVRFRGREFVFIGVETTNPK